MGKESREKLRLVLMFVGGRVVLVADMVNMGEGGSLRGQWCITL